MAKTHKDITYDDIVRAIEGFGTTRTMRTVGEKAREQLLVVGEALATRWPVCEASFTIHEARYSVSYSCKVDSTKGHGSLCLEVRVGVAPADYDKFCKDLDRYGITHGMCGATKEEVWVLLIFTQESV